MALATCTAVGPRPELVAALYLLAPPEIVTGAWSGGQSPSVRASAHAELWVQWKNAYSLTQSWFTEPRWRLDRQYDSL